MRTVLKFLLLLCPFAIFWGFNHQNMSLQFSLILGVIAFPYVMQTKAQEGGIRYAGMAIATGITLLFFRSNSLYYFFAVFMMLFVLEKYWGRLNYLPLLLAVVVSPVVSNVVYIWSFRIRLQLSRYAGKVLQWIHIDIQVHGNVLTMDGHTFSVDPACIGLKMVVTSLVLGIIILAWFERKNKHSLSFVKATFLIAFNLLGAILANFVRLLTLIIFHILPENPMHDVIGLLSLGVYALLPFYLFVKFMFRKKEVAVIRSQKSKLLTNPAPSTGVYVLYVLLLSLQIFTGRQFLSEPAENIQAIQDIHLEGFEREITPTRVLKLQNEEALIYIKPPVRFFQGSHDPRFCWQGSGYNFSEVQIETIEDRSFYTALLRKNSDTLYTAWWYENATNHTPHEWNWRMKSLQGNGGYYMINVSCTEKEALGKWVKKGIVL